MSDPHHFLPASQADLRSWLTLPKDLQILRVQVPPGRYQATLRLETTSGDLGEEKNLGNIEVKKSEIALLQYRSLND
jgi:hypothetical protein